MSKSLKRQASQCIEEMKDAEAVIPLLEEFIAADGDVNLKAKKTTFLCEACRYGHLEVVKYLHEQGAIINKRDESGCTPLYIAASFGHLELVRYLLGCGANTEIMNNTGYTAVLSALQNNKIPCVRLLIDHGANVNVKRPNTVGLDLDVLTYTLFAKGDVDLTMKVIEAGAMPGKIVSPLGYIMLEDKEIDVDFVKKVRYSGFYIESAKNWLTVMKSRMSNDLQNLSQNQIDLAKFIEYMLRNPLTLQQSCRITVRKCVIKSANPERKHFKDRLRSLPDLPDILIKYLTLEYI